LCDGGCFEREVGIVFKGVVTVLMKEKGCVYVKGG
jgi:hypothetical protein